MQMPVVALEAAVGLATRAQLAVSDNLSVRGQREALLLSRSLFSRPDPVSCLGVTWAPVHSPSQQSVRDADLAASTV